MVAMKQKVDEQEKLTREVISKLSYIQERLEDIRDARYEMYWLITDFLDWNELRKVFGIDCDNKSLNQLIRDETILLESVHGAYHRLATYESALSMKTEQLLRLAKILNPSVAKVFDKVGGKHD